MSRKMSKFLVVAMILILSLVAATVSFAAEAGNYVKQADELKRLGLFNGTSKGYELNRAPTRVEVAAMLVKFLGEENTAKEMNYSHPFNDVPSWANPIVGYMYEMKMTNGIGNNKFGAANTASVVDYTVFLLKALGYDSTDFTYDQTMRFAVEKGLITQAESTRLESSPFKRDEMVFLSYKSLLTKLKGTNQTLGEKLNLTLGADSIGLSKSGMKISYLILTETEAQKTVVQNFKSHKESLGFTVYVKSVEKDVVKNIKLDGYTNIEQFLISMDNTLSLDYVMLIGNPYDKTRANPKNTGGIIPMRYLYRDDSNHNTKYSPEFYDYENPSKSAFNVPTDFSYAIDFKWDSDMDGYAGEFLEIINARKNSYMKTRFLLGRIPFSDASSIEKVLSNTINFEKSQKNQSNALIASGILSYPESPKFNFVTDGAMKANDLAQNLIKSQFESTTLYEKDGLRPSVYQATYPLSQAKFTEELKKKYDFVYTNAHGGHTVVLWLDDKDKSGFCEMEQIEYSFMPSYLESNMTGFMFFDGCDTLRVETDAELGESLHFQDLLTNSTTAAGIATTREITISYDNSLKSPANFMFLNKSVIISQEFYSGLIKALSEISHYESYPYVYVGDPSLRLFK